MTNASQRLVDRDAGQPGGEAGRPVELVQVGKRVDVRLLHHVFCFLLVAHD
jgi:hypothetical protein